MRVYVYGQNVVEGLVGHRKSLQAPVDISAMSEIMKVEF